MDTKHNDDILKTRGKIKKGENGQPPSTPQPKKQWLDYKTIHNICKKFKLDEKIIIKQKEPLLLSEIGTICITLFFVRIAEKAIKEITVARKSETSL